MLMFKSKSVKTFLRSLGTKQRDFEKTIASRNMYICSNDPHYVALRNTTIKTHDDAIVSHDIGQYIFFCYSRDNTIYYLSVSEKKSKVSGLSVAKQVLDILLKYGDDAFLAL